MAVNSILVCLDNSPLRKSQYFLHSKKKVCFSGGDSGNAGVLYNISLKAKPSCAIVAKE